MKRMTIRTNEASISFECESVGDIVRRLAAYEDTGLEPEEFKRIYQEWSHYLNFAGERNAIEGAVEDIYDDRNIDYNRLRELAQADREGRCVLLPCKPSDVTVYQLRSKKHARGVGVSPRHISCATVWADGSYALHHQGQDDCLDRDFSKTWFLTREEAEAALRREQDGNNK